MLIQYCRKCGGAIPDGDVNEATDVAFCRTCNLTFDLTELKRDEVEEPFADLTEPPPGAWYRDDGMTKVIGATCRSTSGAIVTGLVAVVWNVPILVLIGIIFLASLGSLGVKLPDSWPKQLREAGSQMQPWMSCCTWLFMTPFVLFGFVFFDTFMAYLMGKEEVTIGGGLANLSRPLCGFPRRKPFNPEEIKRVWIKETRYRTKSGTRTRHHIQLERDGAKPIKLGSHLTDDRRNFVAAALHAELVKKRR